MPRAEVSVFRPSSKLAADKLLSGTGLEEAVEFWRELKKAISIPIGRNCTICAVLVRNVMKSAPVRTD